MSKKRPLTVREQIKKEGRKRRLGIAVKIMAVIIAIAAVIPLCYYGYYTIVFSIMPQSDVNPDKRAGGGFSKPLKIVDKNDDKTYTLAYYYDGCWHVVDDTQIIKQNIDNFMIYKTDDEWRKDSDLHLFIFHDDYVMSHQQLTPFTLIDDRCFRGSMKKMTKAEFEAYCKERNIGSIYIF